MKGVAPIGLDAVLTDDEKKLYDLLRSPKAGTGLNDLIGGDSSLSEDTTSQDAERHISDSVQAAAQHLGIDHLIPPQQVLTLTFSCIAALLAMGCIGIGLYAVHYFRKKAGVVAAWEMMPRTEARDAVELVVDDVFTSQFSDKKPKAAHERSPRISPILFNATIDEPPTHTPGIVNLDSDEESDDEDFEGEEKFHDAEERLFYASGGASPYKTLLPIIRIDSEDHPDPDYLPLPAFRAPTPYSTPPPTPPRSPHRRIVEMREVSLLSRPSSPVSKPAWSLRASDAPSLGLTGSDARSPPVPLPLPIRPQPHSAASSSTHSPQTTTLLIPGSLPLGVDSEQQMVEKPKTRKAYRSPVPELDIAFALQLRPGLGLGSDPAWIVRFLMAMFGWMTVLIGNPVTAPRDRRAIA